MRNIKNKEYREAVEQAMKIIPRVTYESELDIHFSLYSELVRMYFERVGEYPSSLDFDNKNLLPSAKTIQRKFGSLKKFREMMGLEVTNYTTGDTRRKMIKVTHDRARKYEYELFSKLTLKHHNPRKGVVVQREPVISQHDEENGVYGYRRADIGINRFFSDGVKTQYIDFFHSSTKQSVQSCVRVKLNKIENLLNEDDIIFVSVNPDYSQEDIDKFVPKTVKVKVLAYQTFIKKFELE